ncbi:MAG: DUF1015 domain-containing protein [Pseudomonadota bacterium]
MAEIKPFEMVHYGPDYSDALSKLITPPYDVISPEEQESFYNIHPYNIIRLILGKQHGDDTASDNRYTRAAAKLNKWMAEKTLIREQKPCFAIYQMDFEEPQGIRKRLDGLIGLVKVEDYGVGKVLPHEKTYSGPKEDQLELIRACKANLTPIQAMFDDPDDVVRKLYETTMESKPDQQAAESNGTIHRTWKVCQEENIQAIVRFLKDKSFLIADGHHRYETALAYRREIENHNPFGSDQSHKYVMMFITSMSHPGLVILPAHRMLKDIKNLDQRSCMNRLNDAFNIKEFNFNGKDLKSISQHISSELNRYTEIGGHFGMAINGETKFYVLGLKHPQTAVSNINQDISEALIKLDVTILRELVLGHGFGLDEESSETHMRYTPSILDALEKTVTGEVRISFILNPTRVDQMRTAAELGEKMPHKSTYFYPKVSSGLVLNVF